MTRAERAAHIDRRLEELFPEVPVPLEHADAYTLLVAVVLSAQCTDARVNRVTPALFARARTPDAMRRLPVAEIERVIRPCGLAPQKARAIRGLSKMLCERHGGRVPDDLEALQELPGVGRKTALVVMAQAFGRPSFPVDTHIHRLAQQWGLTDGSSVAHTERDLMRAFPEARWNRLHLQFIYYGRAVCPARGCDGMRCEICKTCFPGRRRPSRAKKA
ncbi:MAG: endonuclease III [Verrucomicrobiae bacterium]|nr:endonuclease III [Verrucomicrobiae bacterium]